MCFGGRKAAHAGRGWWTLGALAPCLAALPGVARAPTVPAVPACLPLVCAVGMTTGATIHTTNGLWLNMKPRQQQQQQQQQQPQQPVAASVAEQRELALAFTDPPAGLQQPGGAAPK